MNFLISFLYLNYTVIVVINYTRIKTKAMRISTLSISVIEETTDEKYVLRYLRILVDPIYVRR